jgi:NAD(P)-dependent dehydrogenase (short-subunit alcohol dehydrogenase family)
MSKVVFITGSYSGIGRATAEFFADEDWKVVATMRNPAERKSDLMEHENIDLVHLDVTDPDSIREAVRTAVEKHGHIDVLVNNAGYAVEGVFESATPEQAKKQFDTNVLGLMAVTREVLPVMREQNGGVIVNVSSIGGRMAFPMYTLYNSSKFAVEGFSEGLQYELRPHNIKVVLIEPGVIRTDFYGRSMVITKKEGLTDYDGFADSARRGVERTGSKGSPPEIVAMCIYGAVNDGKWKLRYHAGRYSGLMLTMRRLLPDRAMFGLIRRSSLPKK